MPYIIPNNLLKPTEKVIKPYNCSMIAIDGPTIKGKLNMEGLEIPYDSQYTSQMILNENERDKAVLGGFLNKNITFLMIKAIYDPQDPNWEIEEDHYIEFYYGDEPETIRYMGKLLLLTGNSLKRIPQIYLNNPHNKQKVQLEIFMANLPQEQEQITSSDYIKSLYYNNIISDRVSYTSPVSEGSSSLWITNIDQREQGSSINTIMTIPYNNINTIEVTGDNTIIIGNNTDEKIYLEFLDKFNMLQAHSRISWVLEDKLHRYLNESNPSIDTEYPVITWNNGISETGYTSITTGDTSYIIDTFISGVTDNRDGDIDKYDVDLTIYLEEGIVPLNNIEESGNYTIYFSVGDIAGNLNISKRYAVVNDVTTTTTTESPTTTTTTTTI